MAHYDVADTINPNKITMLMALKKRIKTVNTALMVAFIFILLRQFQLQIHFFGRFFDLGEQNFTRRERINSPRGSILDCYGRPLATNRPVITVSWLGSGNKTFTPEQITLLELLGARINKDLINDQSIVQAERLSKKLIIGTDINFETLSAILEQFPNHKNLSFTTNFKRNYPYKTLACHILGYLGSITSEATGAMGLEKIYEEELKGKPGKLKKLVNSRGSQIAEEEIEKAHKGADLATTIDLDLQLMAEEIFPDEYAGILLIMQPQTGALKVIVSRPSFDPNLFVDPLDTDTWQELQKEKQPFLNRTFTALYPPASLFKLITIAAALETNLIDEESTWDCKGYSTFAGRRYHCNRRSGHGMMTAQEAIAHSCNIPFYEIGKKIKIDTLADYAYRFGLGQKTNSIFHEKTGLVPTSSWKREMKGEPWWPGETLSAVIGQSYLLVTPIQMACLISAICEGYRVKPCILQIQAENIEAEDKIPLDINERTREFLKRSMQQSVKGGTSKKLNRSDIEIYAKTGTAQTVALSKDGKDPIKAHAWLTSYIKYKQQEPITLLVILENAGWSRVAIGVANNFLKKYCKFVDAKQ